MDFLRTPDERFSGLADYRFDPSYTMVAAEPTAVPPAGALGAATSTAAAALRIHSVDLAPRQERGGPILLLHGEPTWSYLYRAFFRPLAAAGHRVLAPDLVGFGRSDKPTDAASYTYERHVAWLSAWLLAKDLHDITLFCQDWGGLIGLRLVAAFPDRFAGVIAANTALPTGSGLSPAFAAWLAYSQAVADLPIGAIVARGTQRPLGEAEIAAYDAPFPDARYKSGARRLPALVPVTPSHPSVAENLAACRALERFDRPFLTAFSDGDPLTAGADAPLRARIPGARGQAHQTIAGAGHFLQEDRPDQLIALIASFARRTG